MMLRPKLFAGCLLLAMAYTPLGGQITPNTDTQTLSRVDGLGLPAAEGTELKQAIKNRDYVTAERILLAALGDDSTSPHAGQLLTFAGAIYVLNDDYLNAAIAWKKSEKIAPLDPSVQFSLAMAYVRLRRIDWAIQVLTSLAAQHKTNALYPYWLGRLHYDSHLYDQAMEDYKHAIQLDPTMARAYDGLGLCYFYENHNDLAIQAYERAVALQPNAANRSPWPYLDLAEVFAFLHKTKDAEANLRTAIQLSPKLAEAHFRLGTVLRSEGEIEPAIQELNVAAQLDPHYPEPHFVLARLYNGLGRKAAAQAEVEIYHRLHDEASAQAVPASIQER